ncbi:TniB family NTP-binding protein [Aquicoccus sp. G2-2]|uniref:TniB family NTP-binding protein n=1 Tax=Aquicoccus sp. G2-2 TaxID=3092120 RepID=UPI002ADFBB66|nr:TniB family NTP-binding protein [Aquicoccus sp. G2-2]MEA1112564.1 TniB family NTP-binding protein [Aquicoccus sp. G2-2]
MDQKTPETLLAAVDRAAEKYLPTDRDEQLALRLNRLLARDSFGKPIAAPRKDRGTGDAHGLLVIEPAGGGKSTLVEHVLNYHPLLQSNGAGHKPWIKVDAPSPATTKSLGIEIVRATGYQDASRNDSEQEIWSLAEHRLSLLGTVFVWIDEGHDLLGAASAFEIRNMQKRLKNLMQGKGAVSVILSGIEDLWQFASSDDQIDRRYLKLALGDISPVQDQRLLKGIIHTLCAEVGIAPPKEPDLIERLVHASRRRFGRFIENTLSALEIAAEAGAIRLEIMHYAENWAEREGAEIGKNVFLAHDWAKIDFTKKPLPQSGKKGR